MPRPKPLGVIDTAPERSVSFAPPDQATVATGERARRPPVPVGPGRMALGAPALLGGASRDGVTGYPIQAGKVQRPPLREETLARHRLLDWLDVKIHNRVVFVVAEAGYGKTTLLADFSRRTRLRTLWYRMDDEDRSWVSFLSYLVAAGRAHDPEFAPRTASLLEETGPGGAGRDDVTDTFLRELPTIAADGAALILDDFHVADDIADVRHIARQLIERGPERLTIVFSSRRSPGVPVARLRALGELAELRTTDLRFSDDETAALFEESYRHPLEPDVLADLTKRTEGWAASLYLVQAALRDRSAHDTRTFVRRLSGAHAELYDYLAEEVVGELPEEHQQFLMATSILQSVSEDAAAAATGLSSAAVATLTTASERIGLLSDRHRTGVPGYRYHPLVREFLASRLEKDIGCDAVNALHRQIGHWAEERDWSVACYHFAAAGDRSSILRTIESSVAWIVGTGEIARAAEYLQRFPPDEPRSGFEVIRSRHAGILMDIDLALAHAIAAVELEPSSEISLGNLLATCFLLGDQGRAVELAGRLASSAESAILKKVGAATVHLLAASVDGTISSAVQALTDVRDESRRLGLRHYEGISLLNLALLTRAQGLAAESLSQSTEAVEILARGSGGSEVVAAQLAVAWAQAHLGHLAEARVTLASAADRCNPSSRLEWLVEAADLEVRYGDERVAEGLLEEASRIGWNEAFSRTHPVTRAELALRQGNVEAKMTLSQDERQLPTLESGFLVRYMTVGAHVDIANASTDQLTAALERMRTARIFAIERGVGLWAGYAASVLAAYSTDIDQELGRIVASGRVYLTLAAEAWISQLHRLSPESLSEVATEAKSRPERWRPSIRRCVVDASSPSRPQAARILDQIGERDDVELLRGIARANRGSPDKTLGRGLARRLALPVMVEDQGRVEIQVGKSVMAGTELRRKVLALLCLLLSKPRFSATRDEVVDALWPELSPEVALNSLNQTVYFLRRVFEPNYKEDLSAGYVNHESDVLWLDRSLIQSRSAMCRALIDTIGPVPSPSDVDNLSAMYRDRFALDFAYEEWAVPYREALHVSYLQVIEASVNRDIENGHYERAIRIARRALDIDRHQESLELSLLRLYRLTGAHSAAAEQYAHYSAFLRDEVGVEPPPLASI